MSWHARIDGNTDDAELEAELADRARQLVAEIYDSHGVTNAQFQGDGHGYRALNVEAAEESGAPEHGAAAHLERESGVPEPDTEPAHPTADEMDEMDRMIAERRSQDPRVQRGNVRLSGGVRSGSK